jgi:hypothetical protein
LNVIQYPSPLCASTNVADLPHYWQSLPSESPLKAQYAPPDVPGVSYWGALAAVVVGILAAASGAVLAGLLVAGGGLAWGAFLRRGVEAAEARLAGWNSSRVCLACTGTF